MADVGAERLGMRLMGEVEELTLGELLASLHALINPSEQTTIFNVPELDALLFTPQPAPIQIPQQQQHHHHSDDDTWNHAHDARNEVPRPVPATVKQRSHPIIELISPPPAYHPSPAGKTALVHLLTTHAVLPSRLASVPLSGLTSAVVLIDPLHHFSVSYLASTLSSHIVSCFTAAGQDSTSPDARREVIACVKQALEHVHIFRPSSWDNLLATLQSLEDYLFDKGKHGSMQRPVHALVIEDIDTFIPALRTASGSNAISTASALLTRRLDTLSATLSCAVVVTSRSATAAGFRPNIPLSWPTHMQLTRLAVRRVEVVPFAPGMSIVEAEAERGQRGEVVSRGRFEVWRVGGGGEKDGAVIRIGRGVVVEREDG
ncbi:hypothetical protein DPSP01_011799 [Paraphaeosphaeria sporulosa]